MKKISIALIVIILFNFIFSNYIVRADVSSDNSTITYSQDTYTQLTEEGKVSIGDSNAEDISVTTSSVGTILGVLASALASPFIAVSALISNIANLGGLYHTDSNYSADTIGWFTINSLVFGEYLLFNTRIYETNESINPSIEATPVSSVMDETKTTVLGFYDFIRLFAIALLLVMLIISGIYLGTATLAEDKVRAKEVLKAWGIGLLFMLLIQFIVVGIDTIVGFFQDILWKIRLSMEENGYSSFESELFKVCLNGFVMYGGAKAFAYAVEYIAFVVIQVMFFGKYIIRSFKIFILIVLSPVFAVMHILSKLRGGDGCLKEWTKQYTMNVLMQPIHALIYLIFMFTASEIALKAPLLGIAFLWVLLRAEKIIKLMLEIDYGKITTLFSKSNNS